MNHKNTKTKSALSTCYAVYAGNMLTNIITEQHDLVPLQLSRLHLGQARACFRPWSLSAELVATAFGRGEKKEEIGP